MEPRPPRISIIIPTLNEVENVDLVTARVLANTESFEVEIIIVDDNSKDGTQEKVLELAKTRPVILLERKQPTHGLAGAVLAGARAATADVVVVMDADLSHPPERLPDLVRPVLAGKLDMVIGSRYAPGGSTPGWPRIRRAMSRAASALAWPLTDVNDALSGFFAVRKELLTSIPSDAAGFKIALEVLVRGGDDLRAGEVPIIFRDRTYGESKMGTKVIFTYMRRLLALSGWRESKDSAGAALAKTGLVALVDFAAYAMLVLTGIRPDDAHIESFWAATVLNLFFKYRQREPEQRIDWHFLVRFVVVCALSLFLRDSFFGVLQLALHLPPLLCGIPAIALTVVVMYLGYALYIWPKREQYGSGIRWRVGALSVIGYSLIIRFFALFDIQQLPHPHELVQVEPTRISKACEQIGTLFFGQTLFGSRIGGYLAWCGAAYFLYRYARTLYGKGTAFKSVMLFSTLPLFFVAGLTDVALAVPMLALACILFSLANALLRGRAIYWAGVGIGGIVGLWGTGNGTVLPGHAQTWMTGIAGSLLLPFLLLSPAGGAGLYLALVPQRTPETRASDRFVLWMMLGSFAVSVALALRGGTPVYLSALLAIGALPTIAAGIGDAVRDANRPGRWLNLLWPATVILLLVLYGTVIHRSVFGRGPFF